VFEGKHSSYDLDGGLIAGEVLPALKLQVLKTWLDEHRDQVLDRWDQLGRGEEITRIHYDWVKIVRFAPLFEHVAAVDFANGESWFADLYDLVVGPGIGQRMADTRLFATGYVREDDGALVWDVPGLSHEFDVHPRAVLEYCREHGEWAR
jgi:hypothetical protein